MSEEAGASRRFLHPLWALFAALVLGLPAAALLWPEPLPLPDYGAAPDFALRDQTGAPVTDESLAGQVWIADFIFTRCPDVCPVLSSKMQGLQRRLPADEPIRLVSITVDPQYDTPPVLAEYAAKFEADPARWRFLTGDPAQIPPVVEGFQQALDTQPPPAEGEPPRILHSQKLVLVDGAGRVRGFYNADEPGLKSLERAAKQLSEEIGAER